MNGSWRCPRSDGDTPTFFSSKKIYKSLGITWKRPHRGKILSEIDGLSNRLVASKKGPWGKGGDSPDMPDSNAWQWAISTSAVQVTSVCRCRQVGEERIGVRLRGGKYRFNPPILDPMSSHPALLVSSAGSELAGVDHPIIRSRSYSQSRMRGPKVEFYTGSSRNRGYGGSIGIHFGSKLGPSGS